MADRVFEDRVGLWVISPANLPDRLWKIKAFGGGIIRDLFLPRAAAVADLQAVKAAGLYAHLYVSPDGLSAHDYANRTLLDIQRLKPGAVELNIELSADPPLPGYIREAVGLIRGQLPNKRLRINVAPWKGFALPIDLLVSDGALYACEQNYLGNMDELLSPADVLADAMGTKEGALIPGKFTVCYAAACRVLGSSERVRTLPDLSRRKRGVIFTDDLMVEAGLL